ncbi:MAG: choice-of-anchor D domain-containing protein [Terriglobales bacterium]
MNSFPGFATSYLCVCLLFGLATSVAAQDLQCQPCRHGFGKVQTGSSRSFNVQLKNSGKRALKITSGSIQGSEFSVGTFPLPMKLAPGATVLLPVIFAPTASGRLVGNVTLTNTGQDSQLQIKLAGTGIDGSSHSVALSWEPGDHDYVGFNIYRSTVDGGAYTKINSKLDSSPSFTDSTVQGGMTYYYAATEVDAQGEESAYSNIAEATIPD